MVRIEHDSYVIEVHTGGNPVESWMKLNEEISYLISIVDQNNCPEDGFAYLPQLLGDMMPSWETARRMTEH